MFQVAMGNPPPVMIKEIDFTDDSAIVSGPNTINIFEESSNAKDTITTLKEENKVTTPEEKPTEEVAKAAEPVGPVIDRLKNPIMTLNELKPGLVYTCTETTSAATTKKFTTSVTIDKVEFEGSGSSKKLAKQACARTALSRLYGVNFTPTMNTVDVSGESKVVAGTGVPLTKFSMDQQVADRVAKLILDKFEELTLGNMVTSRRKVIAGVVMSRGDDMSDLSIVSVTTGTKCICGEYMSASGKGLNDCHAEILSRRCLMRFLYSQLETASKEGKVGEDSVLEKIDKGGYRIKPDVRFHLYINTAPCGDARIFSPHEDKGRYYHVFSIDLLDYS